MSFYSWNPLSFHCCIQMSLLCHVFITGVLNDIQTFFSISNAQVALLQTSFIVMYTIFSPVFGYLGDRYNRKMFMSIGIAIWSGVTLLSSFVNEGVSRQTIFN